MNYNIKIGHIYPDLLDMYGDSGNIATLSKRLMWRGINAEVKAFKSDEDIILEDIDIVLLGGGSEDANTRALSLLLKHKEVLKAYAESSGVLLAFCGGFPMLGKYIERNGDKTEALGILNIYTENEKRRFTGNVLLKASFSESGVSIAGFENHAEKTFINSYTPLGKVLKGFGNCGDGSEGLIYKNVFASYLHGPLLPKNPVLADEILKRALEKKYGEEIILSPLDDTLENKAHKFAELL